MASEKDKGNGHDATTLEMVTLLRQVMSGISQMSGEIVGLKGAVAKTNADLDAFRIETADRLMDLHGEIHGMRELLGSTNERLDQTNDRLDRTNDRLEAVVLDVSELRAEVREVSDDVSGLRGETREVRADVSKLRGELRARAVLGD